MSKIINQIEEYLIMLNEEDNFNYLLKKSIKELIKMQDLIVKQIKIAYDNKNTSALEKLQKRGKEITNVILKKSFKE